MAQMGKFRDKADSTFDINLTPMLDMIVALIPMLLMSVVFMRVNMVEAQVPQIVAEAIQNNNNKPNPISISLAIKGENYVFEVVDNGKKSNFTISSVDGKPNLDGLYAQAITLKKKYPDIFKVQVKPSQEVSLDRIIATLDQIRKSKANDGTFSFKDEKSGNMLQTNLMFPEVVFADVLEG